MHYQATGNNSSQKLKSFLHGFLANQTSFHKPHPPLSFFLFPLFAGVKKHIITYLLKGSRQRVRIEDTQPIIMESESKAYETANDCNHTWHFDSPRIQGNKITNGLHKKKRTSHQRDLTLAALTSVRATPGAP